MLTREGRIVAEFHVIARPDVLWLETDAAAVPAAVARLEKFVIADDVAIADRSSAFVRFGIEGPRTPEMIATLVGGTIPLPDDGAADAQIDGADVVIAAFGWSGETARQIFVAKEDASGSRRGCARRRMRTEQSWPARRRSRSCVSKQAYPASAPSWAKTRCLPRCV